MTQRLNPILLLALVLTLSPAGAQTDHARHENEKSHQQGIVIMTPQQRRAQGIETAPVARRILAQELIAPGEVVINAYRSTQVTPRITAQIVARHARLGDHVDTGQALVTLSSVEMAEAQGALVVADREWQRVRRLGRKVVSERRYVEAQVARQLAYAKVQAYGMTAALIAALLKRGDASKATGAFDLLSPQDGTVISDDFVVGEVVEPGRVLFEITDESVLWVEAKLSPQDATRVEIGAPARISVNGRDWLTGRIIQRHHRLDETTRTQSIRIQVDNRDDRLHPGQFVDVALHSGGGKEVLAAPREAVVLMEGSPTVFKTESDELHPQPVETGATRGGWTEIRAGLAEGDEIVVRGVFLLKSLLLKSRMGEGHAH
jgi:cobalt-zinc-cadmium efflux system membrane fusion protein